MNIEIYTDGSVNINPGGITGSGIAIRNMKEPKKWVQIAGGSQQGTNNIAELKAMIRALEISKKWIDMKNDITITIFSDSQYVINCITDRYRCNANKKIIDSGKKLYEDIKKNVNIKWTKAHVGTVGNELADMLAGLAVNEQINDWVVISDDGVIYS